jgi:membrane-bound metal-dependent hydrolase YbcI (DUF457 family)
MFFTLSRYVLIYGVTLLRRLQEIRWNIFRKLMVFRPLTNVIKVLASVPRVEVHVGLWPCWIPPHLAEYACIDCAHELLPNDVETMSY